MVSKISNLFFVDEVSVKFHTALYGPILTNDFVNFLVIFYRSALYVSEAIKFEVN